MNCSQHLVLKEGIFPGGFQSRRTREEGGRKESSHSHTHPLHGILASTVNSSS